MVIAVRRGFHVYNDDSELGFDYVADIKVFATRQAFINFLKSNEAKHQWWDEITS
jgi:hypothetical protein